ncbi:hypothetical protein, partial [Escherichia coli]
MRIIFLRKEYLSLLPSMIASLVMTPTY